jgi:hypothetical protein
MSATASAAYRSPYARKGVASALAVRPLALCQHETAVAI